MPQTYAGFVDIGYLHAEGAKAIGNNRGAVRPVATDVVAWFRGLAAGHLVGQSLERVYWRQSPLEHPIMAALASTEAGLGLTPGTLMTEFGKHWQFRPQIEQKGVDTLLALDLVSFANRPDSGAAVLITGDLDLVESVRQARGLGVKVIVATPDQNTVARELKRLADEVFNIAHSDLQRMLQPRRGRSR